MVKIGCCQYDLWRLNNDDTWFAATYPFLLALLLLPLTACNSQELYKEGTHYERLPEPVPTGTKDKAEVVELFWYGCPHCFKLEPAVSEWLSKKPDNIEFVRIPAVLGQHWEIGARAYYVAEELGVLEQTHDSAVRCDTCT